MNAAASNQTLCTKDKAALKILGIDHNIYTHEDILELLANFIHASSIACLIFDSFNNFHIVSLFDFEAVCLLVGKRLTFHDQRVKILPLLDHYIIRNVHFSLSNGDIVELFRAFGNVYEVNNRRACPNSAKFSHVLSGQREISFLLPGKEVEVPVPGNFLCLPYHFMVRKLCCACLTEGHSILSCPDIEQRDLCLNTTVKLESDDEDDVDECKKEEDAESKYISNIKMVQRKASQNVKDSTKQAEAGTSKSNSENGSKEKSDTRKPEEKAPKTVINRNVKRKHRQTTDKKVPATKSKTKAKKQKKNHEDALFTMDV